MRLMNTHLDELDVELFEYLHEYLYADNLLSYFLLLNTF